MRLLLPHYCNLINVKNLSYQESARLIIAKLKEGCTLLKIERVGSGKETLYVPTPASSK
jgi:hypothetical protein